MRRLVVQTLGILVMTAAVAAAQSNQSQINEGKRLYETYCVTCHGTSAHGDGQLAKSLRKAPPDLTKLAMAHRGEFPEQEVFNAIDGTNRGADAAHSDMPQWKDVFSRMQEKLTEDGVKARITAIVKYLESIQAKQ